MRAALRLAERIRWLLLVAAVVVVIVFLTAQRQSADVRYGTAPPTATITAGSAGEPTGATLPSIDQMTAMLKTRAVVRLPGSIATWDDARVTAAIGTGDVRILVAPPGLTDAQTSQIYDVENATINVIGTRVAGGAVEAVSGTAAEWRGQFARDDITEQLVTLIDAVAHDDTDTDAADPPGTAGLWRAPTAAELAPVAAALRSTGWFVGPGATLSPAPSPDATKNLDRAFGITKAYVVALGVPDRTIAAPDYGPALNAMFPDTPLVVMAGDWAAYYGPHQSDFSDVATASFYAEFGDLISKDAYPQDDVLGAYLGQITDMRYAGLFDRPLPYHPFDPLRVALPVLPVLFIACVAAFLALSARSLRRPRRRRPNPAAASGVRARMAGLTALAVEVSPLPGATGNPLLTRALGTLQAAREALDDNAGDRQIGKMLDAAERDLDAVGSTLPFGGYRPHDYLRGRLA